MHTMKILDPTGHSTVTWRPESPEEIAAAADQFVRAQSRGARAYATTPTGGTRLLERFDPQAKDVVIVHPMVGG